LIEQKHLQVAQAIYDSLVIEDQMPWTWFPNVWETEEDLFLSFTPTTFMDAFPDQLHDVLFAKPDVTE
jgi:hypothetical protein